MTYRVIVGVWNTKRVYKDYYFDDFKTALRFAVKQGIYLWDVIIEDNTTGSILMRFEGGKHY